MATPETPPRSGVTILNTFSRVAMLVALLSPFITAALTWIDTNTSVDFTEGYQQQLESALGFTIAWSVAWFQMRLIKKRDEPTGA